MFTEVGETEQLFTAESLMKAQRQWHLYLHVSEMPDIVYVLTS